MPDLLKSSPASLRRAMVVLCAGLTLASCGSRQPKPEAAFRADTPFSKVVKGEGDAVCWSVRRAFLSQGYMLDRGGDSAIMSGTKDNQVDDKTNVTLRLQTTCVDNRDGTSTVFASAAEETSKMQTIRNSVSAGVSFATVTVPTSSEDALRVVKRQTITDRAFYDSFYNLVQTFAAQEAAQSAQGARSRQQDRQ